MSTKDAFVSVPAFQASYVDRSEVDAEANDGERSGESPKGVRSGRSPSLRENETPFQDIVVDAGSPETGSETS